MKKRLTQDEIDALLSGNYDFSKEEEYSGSEQKLLPTSAKFQNTKGNAGGTFLNEQGKIIPYGTNVNFTRRPSHRFLPSGHEANPEAIQTAEEAEWSYCDNDYPEEPKSLPLPKSPFTDDDFDYYEENGVLRVRLLQTAEEPKKSTPPKASKKESKPCEESPVKSVKEDSLKLKHVLFLIANSVLMVFFFVVLFNQTNKEETVVKPLTFEEVLADAKKEGYVIEAKAMINKEDSVTKTIRSGVIFKVVTSKPAWLQNGKGAKETLVNYDEILDLEPVDISGTQVHVVKIKATENDTKVALLYKKSNGTDLVKVLSDVVIGTPLEIVSGIFKIVSIACFIVIIIILTAFEIILAKNTFFPKAKRVKIKN